MRHAAPTGKVASSIAGVFPVRLRTGPSRIAAVTDVLIYADTFRSADIRHAIPLGVPDPILYAEAGGTKHVFTHSMEAQRLRALGLFEVHVSEEFGIDELIASAMEWREIRAEPALRAVASLGIKRATVRANFPVWRADRF